MKKTINLIGVLALIAAAVYSAYWYVVADQAEKQFKTELENFQQHLGNNGQFSYDSISKEGFPNRITLRIKNPRIKAVKENDVDLSLDGAVKVSVPLWGKEREISSTGTLKADDKRGHLVFKGDSKIVFLDGKSTHFRILEKVVNSEFGSKEDEKIEFQSFKAHADEFTFNDETPTGKKAFVGGAPLDLDIHYSKLADGQSEVKFYDKHDNLVIDIDPQYFNDSQFSDQLNGTFSPLKDMGKLFYTIEGSVCFPDYDRWDSILENPTAPRKAEACLKLDKWDFKNDLGYVNSKNNVFSLNQDDNKFTLTLKSDAEGEQNAKYREYMQKSLENSFSSKEVLADYFDNDAARQQQFIKTLQSSTDLIPHIDQWGKTTSKVDFVGHVENQGDEPKTADAVLKVLEYATKYHTISFNGDASYAADAPEKTQGRLQQKITKYKEFFTGLIDWLNRVSAFYDKVKSPQDPGFSKFTAQDTQNIINYLRAISDDPNSNSDDLVITQTYDEKNGFRIGTLNSREAFQKSIMLFSSVEGGKPVGAEQPAAIGAPR